VLKTNPFGSELVEIGSLDRGVTTASHIRLRVVVRNQQENVPVLFDRNGKGKEAEQGKMSGFHG
jgi:hypothetical protein